MDWVGSVLMPLLSTAVGAVVTYRAVKWTMQAETDRENQNKDALKRALILGIGEEVEKIYKDISLIDRLSIGKNYAFESKITEDTVAHQLELFGNSTLIEKLSRFRFVLKRLDQGLKDIQHPDVYTRNPIFPTGLTPDIFKNWGAYREDCLKNIGELIALFDQEAPGLLDNKFDYIRNRSVRNS